MCVCACFSEICVFVTGCVCVYMATFYRGLISTGKETFTGYGLDEESKC